VTPIRPKFSNPPLIERAISVHFRELSGFSVGDFGLFWTRIISEFPISETAERTAPIIEQFESFRPPLASFAVVPFPALPRAFFRNPAAGELVQVQTDRFTFNWLKTGPENPYPHSEATIERFFKLLLMFEQFANERGFGELEYLQCELTNVNIVPIHDVGEGFADVATVIKLPDLARPCPSLRLEHQTVGSDHVILDDDGQKIGRVRTLGQPAMRTSDGDLGYRLDITARGAPIGRGREGINAFFDHAVSAINGVFLASITQTGRRFWGEYDGDSIQ